MSLSAVQSVGDAIDLTREFMTPFSPGRLLKLSVVVFLLSGGGVSLSANVPPIPPTLDPTYSGPTADELSEEEAAVQEALVEGGFGEAGQTGIEAIPAELLWMLVAIVLAVALVGLVFLVLAALAEFVFVESLRSGQVTIRRYTARRWRQSLSLLAFRIALAAVSTGIVLAIAWVVFELGFAETLVGAFGYAATGGALVALTASVISSLTTFFVVPTMIQEDRGIVSGWQRLWGTLRADPVEFAVFVVVQYVLGLVLAAVVFAALGFTGALIALALAVPVGAVLLLGGFGVTSAIGLGLILTATVLGLLALAVVAAVLQIPVQGYLRYYALLVLGDLDERLDLVPEQRERARMSQFGVTTGGSEL